MTARIARSLETLRRQIDELYPNRSKVSDGWIGDPGHAARKSDHNPNAAGVVQALDITHDPAGGRGPDTWKLAEILRLNRDHRIKYVISNGRIFSSSTAPWTWRKYSGANKHDKHIHVSVLDDPELYDDPAEWDLTVDAPDTIDATRPPPPDAMRRAMAQHIIDWEARKKDGHLAVYDPGDGTFEIAGINSRFHGEEATALRTLIDAGKYEDAEDRAAEYILKYTDPVRGWTTNPGLEFFLRDTFFNRGPTGAAIVLQKALGVEEDGQVGPTTRGALQQEDPAALLKRLRAAREEYEIDTYGKREHLWRGLTNRWNNASRVASELMAAPTPAPTPQPTPEPTPMPTPTPTPIQPPGIGGSTFIRTIERLVAEITATKERISADFAQLAAQSDELKRLTDRGIG